MLEQQIQKLVDRVREKSRIPHKNIYQLREKLSSLSDQAFNNLILSYIPEGSEKLEFQAYFSLGYDELKKKFSPYEHILLHPNSKVAYIYIPKNACTTMKLSLMQSIQPDILDEIGNFPGKIHPIAEKELRIRSCALPDNLTTLLITRNPIERFWSACLEKLIKSPTLPIIDRFIKDMSRVNIISNSTSFEQVKIGDIIDYLCGSRDDLIDKHFASQSAFLPSKLSTFKIKLENLNNFTSFLEYLLSKPPKLSESPHSNLYTKECNLTITKDLTMLDLKNIIVNKSESPSSSALSESIQSKLNTRFKDDLDLYHSSY